MKAGILFLFCLLVPLAVNAIGPLPFGGFVLLATPCTCVPTNVMVSYEPLYPTTYPFVFHTLILDPGTIRDEYQQFLIVPPPTSWELGTFVPAPTPCMGVPPACPPMADGIIFEVGSSFPGFVL